MSNRKIKPNKKTYYNQERNDFIKQFNILLELNDDKNFINYRFKFSPIYRHSCCCCCNKS